MNYLAHVFLAGDNENDRLGGLLGDFVKGPLPCGLPPHLVQGVALHRSIDSFADRHPAFQRSRARVSAARRRYAGVMVDMFYDHLLAANWRQFSVQALPHFTAQLYDLLEVNSSVLPARLREILPRMRSDDWLSSYASLEATGDALDRIAFYRLNRPGALPGAIVELRDEYDGFSRDFFEFLQDCRQFVALDQKRRPELKA